MLNILKTLAFAALAVSMSVNADQQTDNLKTNLAKILPGNMAIESVEPSGMENVFVVKVGTQTMYVYSKGDYVMVGDVYDAERKVSLGDERKEKELTQALADIPQEQMILMGDAKPRYVTVFTDTDCYYCQQFHKTIPELEARGMQVRYLMFPRAGLESESYHEAVSVWCSSDQATAMTLAKSGGRVSPRTCENPVAEQYQLGQRLGVRGTPTMILDTGKIIPGFLPPDELLAQAGAQ